MKTRNLFIAWICTALLAAFASSAAETQASTNDDPIAASFERELEHETPEVKIAVGEDIDSDELYIRINKPLQTPESEQLVTKEEE